MQGHRRRPATKRCTAGPVCSYRPKSNVRRSAGIIHKFSSRSGESAGLSALRHARGYPLAGRAVRTDDFAAAVENL